MPPPDLVPGTLSDDAARSAGGVVELLDVLWERARESTPAPASASQLRLMYVVDRSGAMRMRALCARLATAPPSVTRMCDRLQAIGFLERLPCPDSGREVTLRLTPAGQAHMRHIREEREEMLHDAINGMSHADRRALAKGLAGLHARLTTTADERGGPGGVSAA
ncbi:MarR family transcriptional regulator [Streptomyces sp. NBC_01239]|uniref:MarR family winged helix-turn-helix transcriptional regulator n=1 Tax=Streptomyces sp. NBC_01239 TaxID=2903792 RepID=UPI002258624C|nr:MarR family transcriptional regulator [Streptomyces sp. NBC_01239]MCX4817720.1 MarR family transcriptional regulator [Streptomyces sp. NBC_01239]